MPFFKVTYLCNSGKGGFSETFYDEAASLEFYRTSKSLLQYAQRRAALSGPPFVVEAARVSEASLDPSLAASRLTVLRFGSLGGPLSPAYAPNTPEADQNGACWFTSLQTATGRRRSFGISAIRDDFVQRSAGNPNQFPLDAALNAAFLSWKNFITTPGDPYFLRIQREDAPYERRRIIDFTTSPTGAYLITTDVSIGPFVGMYVRVKGVKGSNVQCALGVSKVASVVSPTQFTINRGGRGNQAVFWAGGGTVQAVGYTFTAITQASLVRPGTKRTGRAFFVPPGRRRRAC